MKQAQSGAGATRLLITMPWGIGDAIVVGLSAVDQIKRNDQDGDVEIDILCNQSQTEIFAEDPRVHRIIQVDKLSTSPRSCVSGSYFSDACRAETLLA